MVSAVLLALAAIGAPAGDVAALHIPFEKFTLPENGLEVILSEDHALPLVAVNVWYHAGPANEAPQRSGFAHLFEHLMFQGSQHVGDDQHFKLLEARGASGINGTTDYDRTNYFETVPAGDLELALWLESDRMGFLMESLTQAKLDNQRDVVMNERRQSVENVPYGPSNEKMAQTLFAEAHPYHGYVIGSMQDLAAASLADVRDFYRQYYAPANATLVVAGDFDAGHAKQLLHRYFASLPRREAPAKRAVAPARIDAERSVLVAEPVTLPRIAIAWLSPIAFAAGDAEADLLATVLGDGKSSRLYRRLVYELQLAQSVQVSQESLALASVFQVVVVARPHVPLEQLEAEAMRMLAEVRDAPLSAGEVERARNRLLTRSIAQLQALGGFGGKADALNRYNQYVGDPGFFARDMARYTAVTPASVQALAHGLLDPAHRAVVRTVPQ